MKFHTLMKTSHQEELVLSDSSCPSSILGPLTTSHDSTPLSDYSHSYNEFSYDQRFLFKKHNDESTCLSHHHLSFSFNKNVNYWLLMSLFMIMMVVLVLVFSSTYFISLNVFNKSQSSNQNHSQKETTFATRVVCGVTCVHGDCITDVINGDYCKCHDGYTDLSCDKVIFDFDSDQALLSTIASEVVAINPTNCLNLFKSYIPAFGLDSDCYSRNNTLFVQLGAEHQIFGRYFNYSGQIPFKINALPRQTPQAMLEVVPISGLGAMIRTSKSYRYSPNAQLNFKFFTKDSPTSNNIKNINTPDFIIPSNSVKASPTTFLVNVTQRGLAWDVGTGSNGLDPTLLPASFFYTTNEFTCTGVNCFLEAFLTGPSNGYTTTFAFDGSLVNSLSGYQLIKLSSSLLPSSFKNGSILTIGATSTTNTLQPIASRNVAASFNDMATMINTFYVLIGGGKTQSISGGNVQIVVTSVDPVNYPLSLLSNLAINWQCVGPSGSNCGLQSQGLSASISNANLILGNYVITAAIGSFTTLTTNVQIVNAVPLQVTLSPIPAFTSKGSTIQFSALVTSVEKAPSISFDVFQNNIKLSDTPTYTANQNSNSFYMNAAFSTVNTIPYSSLQIIMYLNGTSFNFSTTIMPKPLRFGTCRVFSFPDNASPIYAYESVLALTCSSTIPEKDVKSVTIDIVDSSTNELMYAVSSTKQTSVMTRVGAGNMNIVFSQTDHYGGVVTNTIPISVSYPTSVDPGTYTLQQCVQYVYDRVLPPSNQTTNILTANYFAILLNMCATGKYTISASPLDVGLINSTLSTIFSTINEMRTKVFHSSVDDLAAEYLTPLLVQVVSFTKTLNLYNNLLLPTFGNTWAIHAKFILQHIKPSRISKNNLIALQQTLNDVYAQQPISKNQPFSTISSQLLDYVKTITRSWELQFISSSVTEYSLNSLKGKISIVPNIAEFSGWTTSLVGNVTITFPKNGLTDAFSTSRYRVLTSVFDFSSISSNLIPTSSLPLIQNIYSIDIKRESDDSVLAVNNLQQPIQLLFNISTGSLNSTLLQLYLNNKAGIVCRYFDSVWVNDSTIATTVQPVIQKLSFSTFNAITNTTVMTNTTTTTNLVITCETRHLTSFALFADIYPSPPFINASTNSTNTTNLDPKDPGAVVAPNGLGGGEIAAIVVSILVVCVLVPIVVVLLAVIGFYVVKRKQKSKTVTNSHIVTSDAVLREFEPKSNIATQGSSSPLFISEYRSMKGGGLAAQNDLVTSQSSVTSSPTTSTIVTQNVLGKKYEIIEKIGAGAFGAVFKASVLSQKSTESALVAVKKIQLSGLSELNEKFKEAVAMFKMKHEHLVSLEDALIDEASMSLFLVMKYYAYGDLDQFIKEKKHLSEKVLKQIIVQVCKGLKYLEEERDMLHRDVKPSNIFIESFDTKRNKIKVVLSDFGLARESAMLQSMSFAGTPFFMSPQMLIGSKYSFNADVFSLGCSIFGLTTFDLTVSLAQLYLQKMSNTEEVKEYVSDKIKQCGEKYSDGFIKAVLAMLEYDPEKRPKASQVLAMDFFKDVQ
nr:unnamed protein product [Naegleria fowleri]